MNCCKFPLLALEKTCPLGNGNLFGTHSKIRLRSNLFFSLERNTDKKNIILMSTRCLQSAALSSSVDELSSLYSSICISGSIPSVGPAGNTPHQWRAGFLPDECAEAAEGRSRGGCRGEREGLAAVAKDVKIWLFFCCRNGWCESD